MVPRTVLDEHMLLEEQTPKQTERCLDFHVVEKQDPPRALAGRRDTPRNQPVPVFVVLVFLVLLAVPVPVAVPAPAAPAPAHHREVNDKAERKNGNAAHTTTRLELDLTGQRARIQR